MAIVLLRSGLLVIGSIAASRRIHSELLAKILRLPMSFFDSQPTGGRAGRRLFWVCALTWQLFPSTPTHQLTQRQIKPKSISAQPISNPGRLINRFTKDTEALDTQMAYAVNSALACLVGVVLSIVAVAAVSPWVLVFLVPLSVLYYRVQRLYIATSRELKRLDAVGLLVTRAVCLCHACNACALRVSCVCD